MQFYYIKVGFTGVFIAQTCFPGVCKCLLDTNGYVLFISKLEKVLVFYLINGYIKRLS